MFSKTRSLVRTHPWGSISSKCFGWPPFRPVSTYCPRVFWDSLTRKSPSLISKDSEKIRVILPWNHFSDKSFASVDWDVGSEKNRKLILTINWDYFLLLSIIGRSAKNLSETSLFLFSLTYSCSIGESRSIKLLESLSRWCSAFGDFVAIVALDGSGGDFPGKSL